LPVGFETNIEVDAKKRSSAALFTRDSPTMFDPQIPIETQMQVSMVVIPIVFGILATTAVGLRVLARHISHRALDPSDYVMIAALIVTLAFCGVIAAEPFTGAGMHMTDLVARYGATPIVTYTKVCWTVNVLGGEWLTELQCR
jgi:hypothetical protein